MPDTISAAPRKKGSSSQARSSGCACSFAAVHMASSATLCSQTMQLRTTGGGVRRPLSHRWAAGYLTAIMFARMHASLLSCFPQKAAAIGVCMQVQCSDNGCCAQAHQQATAEDDAAPALWLINVGQVPGSLFARLLDLCLRFLRVAQQRCDRMVRTLYACMRGQEVCMSSAPMQHGSSCMLGQLISHARTVGTLGSMGHATPKTS